ncbi:GNAT family N-acetyltransferase [Sneathiella aquimaris]|uniref:GNAT family N-acetyltransferase n=1 Tax=Sneathiella aquimaris TaxID=2599305 RepID=UPI00146A740C|nr:N-acetyltransferase [Sneathiella aquimaris]
MREEVIFREETHKDAATITDIIKRAFEKHPHSDQKEHLIVQRLRDQSALTLSLVAEVSGTVVGHIAFSPVTINGDSLDWVGLGPVSVDPDYQNIGIGSGLIKNGLRRIEDSKANGCVLLGEPGFYSRFGFTTSIKLTLPDVPADYFMVRPFGRCVPTGTVSYHSAFS